MSELLFLGRPVYDPRPYTRIEPLALAEEGSWHVYAEWSSVLPTEGRAFAPRLQGFNSSSMVAFGVEHNTKGSQERDQFVVAHPREVFEVLDFRGVGAEMARRQLVEVGRPHILAETRGVVAALPGGLCVLVEMVRHPSLDLWVAAFDSLERFQTHAFDERLFEGDQFEGHWVTVPGITVGPAAGVINWCRDTDFLESVLKRLRKIRPHALGAPTRVQIGQIVTQLDRADLFPNGGGDLEPMRERLREFAPSLGRNIRVLDEIVDALGAIAPVRDRLDAEMSERRAEMEGEIRRELEDKMRRELEANFAELRADRDRLGLEAAALAADVEARRAELQGAGAALEEARSAVAGELTRLLGELGEVPPEADVRIAALGERLAARLGEPGAVFEVAAASGPPWTTPSVLGGEPKPWSEFDEILGRTALRWGYSASDLRLADVAARGGQLVILPDEDVTGFVACYAELVAGGGYGRHVLDPSVISLDDLWQRPGSSRHGCFARAWAAARLTPWRFHVLLLDGLHRTPTALWMPGLTEVMRDPRWPMNLLVFAGLGVSSVAPDQDWRGAVAAAVALVPTAVGGTPSRVLNRAVGVVRSASRFDPLLTPTPTAAEAMTFITIFESEASAKGLEAACKIYRAAWVMGADRAASFARAIAGSGSEVDAGLSAGRAWLRKRFGKED